MKILVKIFGAAAALTSVSALAHSGHEHHALQSSTHAIDSMMVLGAVVVALLIARALLRRNEG